MHLLKLIFGEQDTALGKVPTSIDNVAFRNVVFTTNIPDKTEEEYVGFVYEYEKFRLYIIADRVEDSDTPHFQDYLELTDGPTSQSTFRSTKMTQTNK